MAPPSAPPPGMPPPGAGTFPYGAPPGYPPNYPPGGQYAPVRGTNGLAVASLVCSCVGIIPGIGLLGVILGITFGFIARAQIRRTGGTQDGAGLALAGIIIGFVITAIWAIFLVASIAISHSSTS